MKFDANSIPYRTMFQRFQSPQTRARKALLRHDWELAVGLVEAGVLDANVCLDPGERVRDISAMKDSGHFLIHKLTLSLGEDISLLRRLLDAGANPNQETFFSETVAHYAARGGREDILGLLLEYGADFTMVPSIRGTFYDDGVREYSVIEHYNKKTGQNLTIDEFRAKHQSMAMAEAITEALGEAEVLPSKRRKM